MRFLEFADAATFISRAQRLLLRDEATNQLLLSSAFTLARAGATRSSRLSFFAVENSSGEVAAAAMNVASKRLLLGSENDEATRFLSLELGNRNVSVNGVHGPPQATRTFASEMKSLKGERLREQKQVVLQTRVVPQFTCSQGIFRAAKDKEIRLLLEWSLDFVKECGLDETRTETEEVLRRYLEHKQISVWEDRVPVSMVGFGGFTPGGTRVNMVYTPPEQRGKGYARSAVGSQTRKLLLSGQHRSCFLYVAQDNEPAIAVYSKLGYQQVAEILEFVRN